MHQLCGNTQYIDPVLLELIEEKMRQVKGYGNFTMYSKSTVFFLATSTSLLFGIAI
jgi:hypothetical protein